MRVAIDGYQYDVSFSHGTDIEMLSTTNFGVEFTECHVALVTKSLSPDHHDLLTVVESATVRRYFKDPPNREVARKKALAKAIADWRRDDRTKVWKAYFESKGRSSRIERKGGASNG